jgi:hypothetical protein
MENNNNFDVALAHGISRAKAGVLERLGVDAIRQYFQDLKKLYPNRRLNPVEQELLLQTVTAQDLQA